jgi:hypothetical protein
MIKVGVLGATGLKPPISSSMMKLEVPPLILASCAFSKATTLRFAFYTVFFIVNNSVLD